MRSLSLPFSLALILGLSAPVMVQGSVRDASLGTQGDSALVLMRFDNQPETVKVLAGSPDPATVEIFVSGVSTGNTRLVPPDSHLVRTIDMIQGQDGLRLIYHFSQRPLNTTAQVYDHAVLLRARFAAAPQPQRAALHFEQTSPAKRLASRDPLATVRKAHKPAQANQPRAAAPTRDGAAAAHVSRDGDGAHAPSSHSRKRGIGPVREVAYKRATKTLDSKTCAAAKAAIEEDPWALDKLSLYGGCLAKDGKDKAAKEVFERLLTFDPDMVSAYVGLGAIAQHSGDIKAAREYYTQAQELGRTDAEAAQVRSLLASLSSGG